MVEVWELGRLASMTNTFHNPKLRMRGTGDRLGCLKGKTDMAISDTVGLDIIAEFAFY